VNRPPEIESEQEIQLCEDEDYYYFVHGAGLRDGDAFDVVELDRGCGDFGMGFYAFRLCGEDHQKAIVSATKRAVDKRDEKRPWNPYGRSVRPKVKEAWLIYLRIERRLYDKLQIEPFGNAAAKRAYREIGRFGFGNRSVLIGPCLWDNGRRIIRHAPSQVKFEGICQGWLEVIGKRRLA
jgi:hypothetical protein